MRLAGAAIAAACEQRTLPLLGGWKVHLEDAQLREGIAIGKRVETGAENHILRHAIGDGRGQAVFSIAAACRAAMKARNARANGCISRTGS